MKIKRLLTPQTIRKIVESGEIEIELGVEELEAAYREQKHDYLLSDAECQFHDFFLCRFGLMCDLANHDRFVRCYGISADEVEDSGSLHYMLERFVSAFERNHDCNNADNDAWFAAIEYVLDEYRKTFERSCSRCGHGLRSDEKSEYCCAYCKEA